MVVIGADHGGFELKEYIKEYFKKENIIFFDMGAAINNQEDDFPDIAIPLAKAVANKEYEKGILICGSGVGVCMSANRIKGIRAVNCFDEAIARLSRQHNDSNILCLGGRFLTRGKALKIIKIWNKTEFLGGKYQVRNNKLDMI